ncbi:hypothetical protein UNPF46_32855 [Bradyrhizobium sp. UNPF46]|nr:hypothetical protein UNPF46_32855 [Bradyrhizobium sp. UNPF46]
MVAITTAMLLSTAASADECDSKAAEAASKIGGTVSRRMVIGDLIEHPSVPMLGVMCEDHTIIGVVAQSGERTPPTPYRETVSRFIAAVFPSITVQQASSEVMKCQTIALSREREWATSEVKDHRFQCRADADGDGPVLAVTGLK